MESGRLSAEKLEEHGPKQHRCKKEMQAKIYHWFGESSGEDSNNDSSDDNNTEWSTIDREAANKRRQKKLKYKKRRKKMEVAAKARMMVGVGPITDKQIESQRIKSGCYKTAKAWAVKAHLYEQYKYNQEELDLLNIVETKRTNRDEIVYVAMDKEADIRDIYYRKAECKKRRHNSENVYTTPVP